MYFLYVYLFIALCIVGYLKILQYNYGRYMVRKDYLIVATLMYGLLLINILYTAYFGWNAIPKSRVESTFDTIHSLAFILTISTTLIVLERRRTYKERA